MASLKQPKRLSQNRIPSLILLVAIMLGVLLLLPSVSLANSFSYISNETISAESRPIQAFNDTQDTSAPPQSGPPIPPAVPPVEVGFGYGIQADPRGDIAANISHIKTMGLDWVKFQMPWKDVESNPGNYSWAMWDQLIDTYHANGIRILLSIPKAPDWARPVDDDKSVEGPPQDPAQYAAFVAQVAGRYKGKVQAIEIWNEQNLWYEAGGVGHISAANYVQLLQLSYVAIKNVNPEMIVISGALTPAGNVGQAAVDDIDYLNQMYANGVKGYFDALGAHPSGYNCPVLGNWRTVADSTAVNFRGPFENRHHSWCFRGTMEGYREVMIANDDGDKAIIPTEFGWAVSGNPQPGYEYARDNSPEEQAEWIVDAYQLGQEWGWVGPMFLWNLDYGVTAPNTELASFSIINTPAYDALANVPKYGPISTSILPPPPGSIQDTLGPPPALPAVPPVDVQFGYGIQVDPRGDIAANIGHIKTLGLDWVKFQMAWKDVESNPGNYSWAMWDQLIDAYHVNGIQIMLSIPKAPDWVRPVDDDKSVEGPPQDPAKYAEFVAQAAGRYKSKVQAIEIWNEQNLWYEAGGLGRINAANYVRLLQLSYVAIKNVNPEVVVVSGALTPAGNVGEAAVDDIEYLKQMYANGVKGYFDALGVHPSGYNCPALGDWRTVSDATAVNFRGPFENRHHSWCFRGTMEGYREVMVANGDGDKMIVPTEFGWAVSGKPQVGYEYARDNSPEEQAEWIVDAYQLGQEWGWVGPMFLWNLDYGVTAPNTELAHFGIINTPAYDALANVPK